MLEFDHLRDKKYDVSFLLHRGYGINTLLKEIEKCQVLCANHHRKKTIQELGHRGWKAGGI